MRTRRVPWLPLYPTLQYACVVHFRYHYSPGLLPLFLHFTGTLPTWPHLQHAYGCGIGWWDPKHYLLFPGGPAYYPRRGGCVGGRDDRSDVVTGGRMMVCGVNRDWGGDDVVSSLLCACGTRYPIMLTGRFAIVWGVGGAYVLSVFLLPPPTPWRMVLTFISSIRQRR